MTEPNDSDLQAARKELAEENERNRQLASDREKLISEIIADGDDPGDYDLPMPGYAEICDQCGYAYLVPEDLPHVCPTEDQ